MNIIGATGNIMDGRAILRLGIGFYTGTMLLARLESLFRIHAPFGLPEILTVAVLSWWGAAPELDKKRCR